MHVVPHTAEPVTLKCHSVMSRSSNILSLSGPQYLCIDVVCLSLFVMSVHHVFIAFHCYLWPET